MTERTLYVDGDVLVYEAAFAAQKTIYTYMGNDYYSYADFKAWCEENNLDHREAKKLSSYSTRVEVLPPAAAIMIARKKLGDICAAAQSDKVDLILSGDGNYREEFAVTKGYKANRQQPKPQHYLLVRSFFMDQGAEIVSGIEADDAIGIRMADDPEGVICTIDKDLNAIPGRHYNWGTGAKYNVGKVDSLRWFCKQVISGDATDNIPGLPKWGEKKASDVIDPFRTDPKQMWEVVKNTYKDVLDREDYDTYLNEQGILCWIQRRTDERWNIDYFEETYL